MSNIEREVPSVWVLSHREYGIRPVLKIGAAAALQRQGWTVEEYVPRSQLRGAVDALRAIEDVLRDGGTRDTIAEVVRQFFEPDASRRQ